MDWITYANQGATRNLPLSSQMTNALSFLPELGVTMKVFSGGQPAIGSGKPRVGSTRHDHGNAADVFFYKDGQRLDWANPAHVPIFQEIVTRGKQAGLTGFGAGDGYMQPGSMHIGFGTPAVWGAGGKGANAPEWLRAAYNGAPQGTQDIADETMAALGKPPIRPQGILSTSSPQTEAPMEEQKATGLLGSLFPNMTADRQDRLVMALSGLSMNPNQGIMQMAGQRMADRRDDRKEAKTQAAERQRANVTAQWLAQQPGGQQYAQAIASGALPASAALSMWQAASQGQEPTALMQNVEFIRQQNPGMSFEQALQAARSGQTINVNGQAPSPATGYRNVFDEQGRLVAQEPIPGGPVATEQEQAAAAQERATQAQESQQQTTDNVVLNQVNAIRGMLDNKNADGKQYMDIIPEVGPLAEFLSSPKLGPLRNQEAVNMRARLGTLQGMVAFDQLRQMREASPTGGALGAISERELDLLSSQLGTLEQATDPDVIRETLDLLESVMRKADAYPNASQFGFGGTSQATPKVRTFNPQTGRLE